jgi:hypothetical protein
VVGEGTLHLVTAEDLPLYVAALQQHDRWWKGAWLRMIGMKEKELRAILEAIRASLGAKPMTRDQLAEKVAAKVGAKGRDRMMSGWGEMLKPAAFHGYLVSGPPRGAKRHLRAAGQVAWRMERAGSRRCVARDRATVSPGLRSGDARGVRALAGNAAGPRRTGDERLG